MYLDPLNVVNPRFADGTPAKDKVLSVQNSRGHYFLPGGGIENEESYQECLEREMLEETGYRGEGRFC